MCGVRRLRFARVRRRRRFAQKGELCFVVYIEATATPKGEEEAEQLQRFRRRRRRVYALSLSSVLYFPPPPLSLSLHLRSDSSISPPHLLCTLPAPPLFPQTEGERETDREIL